jgi:hypothetical protein
MKRFKDFLQEADIIKFPGPKKPETPKGPPVQMWSNDEIKAHAADVGDKVNKIIKSSGRHLESPTLSSSYGTDKRSHPDIYTQLSDHIHRPSEEIDSNPEVAKRKRDFAVEHYRKNRNTIHAGIDSALKELEGHREKDLEDVQGRAHDLMIRRAYDIPMTQLKNIQERLRKLDG